MNNKTFYAVLLALASILSIWSCEKVTNDEQPVVPSISENQEPSVTQMVSIANTTWAMIHDEWWTPAMHVIDTMILRFGEHEGTHYHHSYANGYEDVNQTYSFVYEFDEETLSGILTYEKIDKSYIKYDPSDSSLHLDIREDGNFADTYYRWEE